jgi:hypothetical protein
LSAGESDPDARIAGRRISNPANLLRIEAFDVQQLIRDGQQGRFTPPNDARGLSVMLRGGGAVWQWKTKDASDWTKLSLGRTNGPNRIDLAEPLLARFNRHRTISEIHLKLVRAQKPRRGKPTSYEEPAADLVKFFNPCRSGFCRELCPGMHMRAPLSQNHRPWYCSFMGTRDSRHASVGAHPQYRSVVRSQAEGYPAWKRRFRRQRGRCDSQVRANSDSAPPISNG